MERIKYKNSHKLKGIVDRVFVTDNEPVKEGQTLATISTQGDKFNVIAHTDGVIRNVYIIESLVVSHGDIIFDIYSDKDIKRKIYKNDVSNTLRMALKKSGILEDDINSVSESEITDEDFDEFDYTRDDQKERTMRFDSVGDNNKNNFHGDIPTDEQFSIDEENDLDFSASKKEEAPVSKETIELNIPNKLENLDDLTIMNDSLQKRNESKEDDQIMNFKSDEVSTPTEILKDNEVEASDLTFETFQIPQTTVSAEKRLVDDKAAMEEALKQAINYDSVTQVFEEINVKPVKGKESDIASMIHDFDVEEDDPTHISTTPVETVGLDKKPVDIEEKTSTLEHIDFSSMDNLGNMNDIKASLVPNEPQFEETATIEVIKRVDAQIESEKSEQPVDISKEAMNKSFERKMQSNFLSAFSNAGANISEQQTQEGIYENLSDNIKDMHDNKNAQQPEPVEEDVPEVNAEELDRIESLLNIDDFDLDGIEPIKVSTPVKTAPTPIQKEIIKEVITSGISNDEVEKIILAKTEALNKNITAQKNEIQELKNQILELASAKPSSNSKLTFNNIKTSSCEFTFKTNVTALMNLHSILVDPFSLKGINLTFGTFAALGVAKAIVKNNIDTDGLAFNWVEGLEFKNIKMACSADSTIAEVAKSASKLKSNSKLKTNVSLFDMTDSIMTSANIATSDILTIVIGKIDESADLTGTLTSKLIFDKNRFSLDDALKFVYEFNALIENPGFLI
jgi:hypothetical protein